MRRFYRSVLALLLLFSLPTFLFAALATPQFQSVLNYSGPLVIFWNTGNNDVQTSQYYIFVSSHSLAANNFNELISRTSTDTAVVVAGYPGSTDTNTYKIWDNDDVEDGKTYYFRIAAVDGATSMLSAQHIAVTSDKQPLSVSNITSTVDSVPSSTLDYDSHTIVFAMSLRGSDGAPFLGPASVKVDIKTNINPETIFLDPYTVPVSVTISSSAADFSATAAFAWDGSVYTDKGNKHYGWYRLSATPVDNTNAEISAGKRESLVYVDVVHLNQGRGLVYTVVGNNTPHYGPPFYFDYYLSKSCFVTWKIYDRNQTADTIDDTLVRVVVSTVPRVRGDETDSPADWNKNVMKEVWDGRDERGFIVTNDVYRYTVDAIEFWGEPSSGFNETYTDRSFTYGGLVAFDVLRLIDIASTGITDEQPLAHLKYTLAGANSLMGGAKIKIVICTPGTTMYMATGTGSVSYLNGAATYSYVPGDPLPTDASRIKKVFTFLRSAGSLDETWNGYDEAGNALPNDNYLFALSAIDDSGNHAIDNSGNDRIVVGNVTIDRTAAQQAGDSTPPTVSAIAVGGTTIANAGGSILTDPFTEITVTLADLGGSGVDLAGTLVTLTGPTTTFITLTATNNNTDTITLSFARQTTNGAYTLRIRPRDTVGNTASDLVCAFTLNAASSGPSAAAFNDSIYAYPNPARGVNAVNFAYTAQNATTLKLEVYNLIGELVYDERWDVAAAGAQSKSWSIVNKAQSKLASGVYLYRVTDENSTTKSKKLRKLVVIQ
ncbi:MAG: T9SS type A sorting domain-containing protein [Endomicrobiales bacterium]